MGFYWTAVASLVGRTTSALTVQSWRQIKSIYRIIILLVAANNHARDRRARIMESKGLVIVAVGLPGAGKSRFHEKFLPDAVRCCQDLLKRREKVEALVEETVRAGGIAYVDRTDLDPKQRSHWVKIAKRCNVEVVALRFTADVSTCIERAKARAEKGEHDGELNNPDKVAGLVGMLKNRQKPIGKGERFDQVLEASEEDHENVALVNALLGRTPSPTKRKAEEPDTQYLDSPGFLPPQQKRTKTDVVDLTAED